MLICPSPMPGPHSEFTLGPFRKDFVRRRTKSLRNGPKVNSLCGPGIGLGQINIWRYLRHRHDYFLLFSLCSQITDRLTD